LFYIKEGTQLFYQRNLVISQISGYLLGGCSVSSQRFLIQNSPAVKESVRPQKGHREKRCEIQGGGQEMA